MVYVVMLWILHFCVSFSPFSPLRRLPRAKGWPLTGPLFSCCNARHKSRPLKKETLFEENENIDVFFFSRKWKWKYLFWRMSNYLWWFFFWKVRLKLFILNCVRCWQNTSLWRYAGNCKFKFTHYPKSNESFIGTIERSIGKIFITNLIVCLLKVQILPLWSVSNCVQV